VLFFASPPLAYDRHDLDQQRRLLSVAFAGEGWEVPRLLEAMWQAPDLYFDSVSQVHMDRWSSGRVALVGDAAYGPSPMAGVATSLALVGAYVLAGSWPPRTATAAAPSPATSGGCVTTSPGASGWPRATPSG
jgi:2-polyprenyl-6-methoxyphenol hydroxylase-like FAD-dependent oxidoreductase